MTTKEMTRLISEVLLESQEFWTANNQYTGFEFLDDNAIVVNREPEDGSFLIEVTKIPETTKKVN
jgi:hypothetical protein